MWLLSCGQWGLLYSIIEKFNGCFDLWIFQYMCAERMLVILIGSESLLLYVGKEETQ